MEGVKPLCPRGSRGGRLTAAGAILLSSLALLSVVAPARAHWESARTVDNGTSSFGATQSGNGLAAAPNGFATALFFQTGPGAPSIQPYQIRRAPHGTDWSSPAVVTTPAGSYDSSAGPELAAGSDGGALGVFHFRDSSPRRVTVATSWAAGAQAPDSAVPVFCSTGSSECFSDAPQVALDGAGNGYAAATLPVGNDRNVLFASRDATTGQWSPTEVVASGNLPQLAVNEGGDVVIVYTRPDGSGVPNPNRLYGKRRLASESAFGPERRLSGPNSNSVETQGHGIVIDPFGDATAVFTEGILPGSPPSVTELFAVAWSRLSPVPDEAIQVSGGSGTAKQAVAAVDPEGRVTAVWQESVGHGEIVASQLTGLGWSTPEVISGSDRNASTPQVAVDSGDTATVVFSDASSSPQGGDSDLKASRRPTGGSWSVPVSLRSTASGAGTPQSASKRVAAALTGQADVTFVQQLNGVNRLFATRFDHSLYPRPGGAAVLRVPLVPVFAECETPNRTHAAPLDQGSCTPSALESPLLTTSTLGRGSASARLRVIPGNSATSENEADVGLDVSAMDVRKASDGSDYTGKVILTTRIRITDRANPDPEEPGTVQDTELSLPIDCVATPGSPALGGSCSLSATANALVPGFAQEGRRTVISILTVELLDAGGDGSVTPPSGACPPTCGSGDESSYLGQGIFAP